MFCVLFVVNIQVIIIYPLAHEARLKPLYVTTWLAHTVVIANVGFVTQYKVLETYDRELGNTSVSTTWFATHGHVFWKLILNQIKSHE